MIEWLLLAVLIVLSIVDIIWKKIPSGFLTGLLFLVAVTAFIQRGNVAIIMALFTFIIAWAFLEFGVPINGVADLKVMTMIGFLILDLRYLFLFIAMTMVFGLAYQLIMIRVFKIKENDDVAFIPILTITYIALLILSGII